MKVADVRIPHQDFFIATVENDSDSDGPECFDGILGLGFLNDSWLYYEDNQTRPPLYNYMHVAKRSAFSFFIGREDETSWFISGMPDPDLYDASSMVTLDVAPANPKKWAIDIDGIYTADSQLNASSVRALLDTGAPAMWLPNELFSSLLSTLAPSEVLDACEVGRTVTCNCTDGVQGLTDFEVIYVSIGDRQFPLCPEDYIVESSSG
eukprot:5609421-Amphidinium_carterae.1